MITLFTRTGQVQIDPATVTDRELRRLGISRAWVDKHDWQGRWSRATTDGEKLQILAERLQITGEIT
jgi:hypothetical protein